MKTLTPPDRCPAPRLGLCAGVVCAVLPESAATSHGRGPTTNRLQAWRAKVGNAQRSTAHVRHIPRAPHAHVHAHLSRAPAYGLTRPDPTPSWPWPRPPAGQGAATGGDPGDCDQAGMEEGDQDHVPGKGCAGWLWGFGGRAVLHRPADAPTPAWARRHRGSYNLELPSTTHTHRTPAAGDEDPGIIPADIVFIIDEKPHARFSRDGINLIYRVTLPLADALCGTTVPVGGRAGGRGWGGGRWVRAHARACV